MNEDTIKQRCKHFKKNEWKEGYDCRSGCGLGAEPSKCTPNICSEYKKVETEYKLELAEAKLSEIVNVITNFSKKQILTFPDKTKEENYKLIAEQYATPIREIIKVLGGSNE